jgi:hypothetical protein
MKRTSVLFISLGSFLAASRGQDSLPAYRRFIGIFFSEVKPFFA